MAQTEHQDVGRRRYVLHDYDCTDGFTPGQRILDIGFGEGHQLQALARRGCIAIGIDTVMRPEARHAAAAASLVVARAEQLPFRAGVFDGVITKVVLPYTDDDAVVREVSRVLRPGSLWDVAGHGLGYYVSYVLLSRSFRRRIYALRTICNTLLYRATGRRWLLGDSVYQSRAWLERSCARADAFIVRHTRSPRFFGLPIFLYLRFVKAHPLPERTGPSDSGR